MSKRANPAVIGAFVLGAVVLIIVGVVVFGAGQFFAQKQNVVAYFSGSVKGLGIGAPVKVRGVTIGSVTNIEMEYNPEDFHVVIPVYFRLDFNKIHYIGVERASFLKQVYKDPEERMQKSIKQGLRAQLQLQSFVTGQLFVALDFLPDTPVQLTGRAPEDYVEVPTIPSPLEELTKSIEKLPLRELANEAVRAVKGFADLVNSPVMKNILHNLDTTLEDIDRLVNTVDAEVKPLASSAEETLADARTTLTRVQLALSDAQDLLQGVDTQVEPIAASVEETLAEARATLQRAQKTLADVDDMITARSPTRYRINETLNEVERAARSIRVLADELERHPEALLRGKPNTGGQ